MIPKRNMTQIPKLVAQIRENPKNVRFTDLVKVCDHYFGNPRQKGTSHCVYKTPWMGDPRVNIQDKKGKAKPDRVRQVLMAIAKIDDINNG